MSMQTFIVQCTDQRSGRNEEKRVQAASVEAAAAGVREQGYAVLNVRPEVVHATFDAPAAPRAGGGAGLLIPIVVSGVALLAAVAALVVSLVGGGSGGLSGYSFSSPEAALKSVAKINATMDLAAMVSLQGSLTDSKKTKQVLDSIKIEGTPLEYKSSESDNPYKVVLYSMEDADGKRHNSHMVLFKTDSGRWLPHRNSLDDVIRPQWSKAADGAQNVKDEDVKKKIQEWEAKAR